MKRIFTKRPVKWILAVLAILIVVGLCMDTEPPAISVKDQTVEYGTTLAFKDFLEVTDNRSDEILIEAVSTEISGVTIKNDEQIVYKITDSSGNTTTKNATVTVNAPVSVSASNTAGAQVMITNTGSCYHTHKCGNGTYYWVSLDEALSRGLRACSKCY